MILSEINLEKKFRRRNIIIDAVVIYCNFQKREAIAARLRRKPFKEKKSSTPFKKSNS
jgi:hypothetical protein